MKESCQESLKAQDWLVERLLLQMRPGSHPGLVRTEQDLKSGTQRAEGETQDRRRRRWEGAGGIEGSGEYRELSAKPGTG